MDFERIFRIISQYLTYNQNMGTQIISKAPKLSFLYGEFKLDPTDCANKKDNNRLATKTEMHWYNKYIMRKVKGKIIVAGSAACGKSALLQLYTTGEVNFLKDYQLTQIADIHSKLITFEQEEKDVELFFFDLAGSDVYGATLQQSSLLQNVDLVMLVYDLTSKSSFQQCEQWYNKIKQANGSNLSGVLVATKLDLKQIRQVTEAEGIDLAKKLKLEFFQVSTARNQDIDHPFQCLAKQLLK